MCDRQSFRGNRISKVRKGKISWRETKNPRNGFNNSMVGPGGKEEMRFFGVRFLTSEVVIKIQTYEIILSNFSGGHNDQNKIICKHQMIKISEQSSIKPWNKINRECFVENGRKVLGDKKEKERGDVISLSDPPTVSKPGGVMNIKGNGERHRGKTRFNPINPNLRETHPLKSGKNSYPFNSIKGLLYVYF